MGLNTIEAKRKELTKRVAAIERITAITDKINVEQARIEAETSKLYEAQGNCGDNTNALRKQMDELDVHGIPEFEQYRQSLAVLATGMTERLRALPTKPLHAALARVADDPDFASKTATMAALIKAGEEHDARLTAFYAAQKRVSDAVDAMWKVLSQIKGDVDAIDAGDVPEFVHYKQSLLNMIDGKTGNYRTLPIKPLQAAVSRLKTGIDDDLRKYYDKLAANRPTAIKIGMVFADTSNGWVYEIASDAKPAASRSLKGDAALLHNAILLRNGKRSTTVISKADLARKTMKYLRTA